jgi:hypothetical protein
MEAVLRLQEEYEVNLRRLERLFGGTALASTRYKEQKRRFARMDDLLGQALHGLRWLSRLECARTAINCVQELEPKHYHLHAFGLMSNHTHPLMGQRWILYPCPCQPDGKHYTALSCAECLLEGNSIALCNRVLGRHGQFWQHESYDHVVQDAGV